MQVTAVDALALAEEAGSAKATNVVLLGVTASRMGYDRDKWLDAVRAVVPPKTVAVNEKAFTLGYEAVK